MTAAGRTAVAPGAARRPTGAQRQPPAADFQTWGVAATSTERIHVNVDYRLLGHFEASTRRLEAARWALPAHWREDPRPEARIINEHWVDVIARAAELGSDRMTEPKQSA